MTLTLVHGGHVLERFLSDDEARLHADAAVAVRDGIVQAIAPFAELRRAHPDAQVLGGAGFDVIPGLALGGVGRVRIGCPARPSTAR